MFGRRAPGCCKSDWPKGKEVAEAGQRETVEMEACVLELEVGEKVDDAYALHNITALAGVSAVPWMLTYQIPQQTPVQYVHRIKCQSQ